MTIKITIESTKPREGKTTIAHQIGDMLARRGVPADEIIIDHEPPYRGDITASYHIVVRP